MSQSCPVCIHPSRAAIEQAILNAKPKVAIARDFGFTYTAKASGKVIGDHKPISRHIDTCMPKAYAKAMEEREDRSGVAMVARLEYLDEKVNAVIERAEAGEPIIVGDTPLLDDDGKILLRHDNRLLLAAVREARGNVELTAKLAGAIPDGKDSDMEKIRARLEDPATRALLAELDRLDGQKDAQDAQAGS